MKGTDWTFWPGLILGGSAGVVVGWWAKLVMIKFNRMRRAMSRDA